MSLLYRHAHMSLTEEHWLDTSLNKILILKRIKSTLDSTIISHIAYILTCRVLLLTTNSFDI